MVSFTVCVLKEFSRGTLHNEQLRDLQVTHHLAVKVMKLRPITHIGWSRQEMHNRNFVGKPLGRQRRRWENSIEMDLEGNELNSRQTERTEYR
jgi:hypothetical protein